MINVLIEKLEFECIIGLLDFERTKEQKIQISAKFRADEFIDYAEVCSFIKDKFKQEKFMKIEDALAFFEMEFKARFSTLKFFYMKVLKPQILAPAIVGAEISKNY
ncbi:dihydroneopterin aldolase [Campylobacter corcagiensis]|uniref:Dihydroneopterin aldolase n=1 Tax=Campylobacter corcagiensis TaxID=1448857 RepID=A0A7M1LIL8_9BACT|nr:dihydroneopterin aldolase [Campylobacter corcagiensis]QKF64099.1 dihydroneopterin aldolase [Campylobacter corcagiensis]QOQ87706.1 dihydroneopterin aldolase [Campylobacter corcagiensis]